MTSSFISSVGWNKKVVGGVVLGAWVELEQLACWAEMPCPWPYMIQVQWSVWEVQYRMVCRRKELGGRSGVCKENLIQISPLNLPLAQP